MLYSKSYILLLLIGTAIIGALPIATAQDLPIVEQGNYEKFSQSKNYACSDEILADESGNSYVYRSCVRNYEPCVTESYLEIFDGTTERKYRCESNFRADYYFIVDNEILSDAIHKKADDHQKIKENRFDNLPITNTVSGNQNILHGSFEYRNESDIEAITSQLKLLVNDSNVIYGQIQTFKTWHHLENNKIPCELLDEVYFGNLPDGF